ncbi:MAG: cupin domain-containing protein [Actinomycetota bacterium]
MRHEKPMLRVIPAQDMYEGKQRTVFFSGISAQSVGSQAICMHINVIPPGARGKAHLHHHAETAIYVIEGEVEVWAGEGLTTRVVARPGDFIYIPAGEPHLPVNMSDTQPVRVILARTDPNEQESTWLLPGLDGVPDAAAAGT